ncbi:hypothetical protein CBM2629_B40106 [Cupriavidus taiwanensis]|nr:hypothetical protein CBM2629_B40106 [Cupriavidus taiwanensis]
MGFLPPAATLRVSFCEKMFRIMKIGV